MPHSSQPVQNQVSVALHSEKCRDVTDVLFKSDFLRLNSVFITKTRFSQHCTIDSKSQLYSEKCLDVTKVYFVKTGLLEADV